MNVLVQRIFAVSEVTRGKKLPRHCLFMASDKKTSLPIPTSLRPPTRFSSKTVLRSPFYCSWPSDLPSIETQSKVVELIRAKLPQLDNSSTVESKRKHNLTKTSILAKSAGIVLGLNQVTKYAEKNMLDLIIAVHDFHPAHVLDHLPPLCYVNNISLFPFQLNLPAAQKTSMIENNQNNAAAEKPKLRSKKKRKRDAEEDPSDLILAREFGITRLLAVGFLKESVLNVPSSNVYLSPSRSSSQDWRDFVVQVKPWCPRLNFPWLSSLWGAQNPPKTLDSNGPGNQINGTKENQPPTVPTYFPVQAILSTSQLRSNRWHNRNQLEIEKKETTKNERTKTKQKRLEVKKKKRLAEKKTREKERSRKD